MDSTAWMIQELRAARADAREARNGSADQHDAANRGGHIVYELKVGHGLTDADIDERLAALDAEAV